MALPSDPAVLCKLFSEIMQNVPQNDKIMRFSQNLYIFTMNMKGKKSEIMQKIGNETHTRASPGQKGGRG